MPALHAVPLLLYMLIGLLLGLVTWGFVLSRSRPSTLDSLDTSSNLWLWLLLLALFSLGLFIVYILEIFLFHGR
ncbi:MAG: hypothetical protein U0401_26545 [Anaerolineae bacterium]